MPDKKKSYYAVIPANVRYDESLPPNAKLLYGEITALCNAEGHCWASNKYFAELYGVTFRTVANWLRSLSDKGYIKSEVFYKQGSKEVEKRFITIIQYPPENNFSTYGKNFQYPPENNFSTPPENNFIDNITDINTTVNITNEYIDMSDKPTKRTRFIPPSVEEVQAYCDERQNNIDAEKFISYYTSNGWKVGRNKMKDWKATVRTWERNGYDTKKPTQQKPQGTGNFFIDMMMEEGDVND
jgi:transposase